MLKIIKVIRVYGKVRAVNLKFILLINFTQLLEGIQKQADQIWSLGHGLPTSALFLVSTLKKHFMRRRHG